MNATEQEKRLLEKAKGLLCEAAENLDSLTKRRLERIRLDALSAADGKEARFFLRSRWVTAGAFAAAGMAAVAVFFWLRTSPGDFLGKHIEDFEIIASTENIDFYENLDFYRWLTTEENGT
ncbi:MAG TPA: hypothetical protein VK568_05730 [Thermodesulfobacteriota bacterium]|nr:hypothetical protein [Thermodesulfobacteriota bacterium]